ncbi:MAG: OB-fold nucleic acid binding domain-containing protein [Kofleriaceae bacterium]
MNRLAVCFLLLASCDRVSREVEKAPGAEAAKPAESQLAAPQEPKMAPPAAGELSGTVLETMDAGTYTYARLDRGNGTEIWVAGPATKLAVGTRLGRMEGNEMPNFHSKTLDRSFDLIYFVNAYAVAGGEVTQRPPVAAATPADGAIAGTITQTMNAGGYTYALLEQNGKKIWIAGPETKIAVGTKVGPMTGSLMTGFRSETLARTFDEIYFVSGFGGGAPAAADPHASSAHGDKATPVDPVAPAPGGKTVATIFADKLALSGKPVVVRGKVTKVTTGVMGKNWLHLRDGSGSEGTNDLIVTTQGTPKIGDIVVARGTVAISKDFGAGYTYPVLLEDATLTTQ